MRTWASFHAPIPPPILWEYREGLLKWTVRLWESGQKLGLRKAAEKLWAWIVNNKCFDHTWCAHLHILLSLHSMFSLFSVCYKTLSWESLGLGGSKTRALVGCRDGTEQDNFTGQPSLMHTKVLMFPCLSQPVSGLFLWNLQTILWGFLGPQHLA